MIWTNKYNLPAPLASAIRNDTYETVGDISVTGLLKPHQLRELERRHKDEITEDVSDHLWRLLGQSVHAVLERADTTNHLAEERLTVKIDDVVLSGKPDLLDSEGVLSDYKVTSVWSFILGDKPEWENQLNVYKWIYEKYGFKINKLQIVAILRDWTRSKADESDYPPVPFQVVEIPIWPDGKAEAFVRERVNEFKVAHGLPSESLPICTKSERWERPSAWAVMKEGRKRAINGGVFSEESQAETLLEVVGRGHYIEFRPGESVRCENFCKVNQWCHQYQKTKEQVAA